ncbi:hypothetical protein [Parapedobacter tibetensis]|uniref:hypothetical protein n=1 Tax=Parapedobacter tibetensis TaxID=2972951 RepID=UPI00214D36FE|nr:hypothetical protein [Parapedobacter tibetensis]
MKTLMPCATPFLASGNCSTSWQPEASVAQGLNEQEGCAHKLKVKKKKLVIYYSTLDDRGIWPYGNGGLYRTAVSAL